MFLNSQTPGRSWDPLGRSRVALRALLGTLGELLGRSWAPLGRSWGTLGRSWDALGTLLDATWKKGHSDLFFELQLGGQNPPKLAQNPFKNYVKKNIGF